MRVNTIYDCIQGEGALAGTPMTLIRLQGCSVGCSFCDTKETWHPSDWDRVETIEQALGQNPKWCEMSPADIARAIQDRSKLRWALVTGGEPAEQDLGELVEELHSSGFQVALETSGTALGHMDANFDWLCISPKLEMHRPFLPEACRRADEIKMVVGKPADIDRLCGLLDSLAKANIWLAPGYTVSLQPVSQNPKATELCVQACMTHNWRLSLQLHKYIGQP
jgi:7-carboxy-7-deazaguanine synthase